MAAAPITSAGASRLGGLGHRQSFLVAVGIVLVVAVGVVLALCLGGTATACAFFLVAVGVVLVVAVGVVLSLCLGGTATACALFWFVFFFGRFNFLAIPFSVETTGPILHDRRERAIRLDRPNSTEALPLAADTAGPTVRGTHESEATHHRRITALRCEMAIVGGASAR